MIAALSRAVPLQIKSLTFLKRRERSWGLEPIIFASFGIALAPYISKLHSMDVVSETMVLVVFLAGLMGVTRSIGIPIGVPLRAIPCICGFGSMFMDSFLILLILARAEFNGTPKDITKLKVYGAAAALIGGIGTYFGEVYLLPLCLKYDLREWWSMIPIWPPVTAFLWFLSRIAGKLEVQIDKTKNSQPVTWQDVLEFSAFIFLLLFTKNALFCLFALIIWSGITGQGHDFIDGVWEIDKAVLGLLGFCLLILYLPAVEPTGTWVDALLVPITNFLHAGKDAIANCDGWRALIPALINAVLTGALFPAAGDFWFEVLILTTGVLPLPSSSLVCLMVFRPKDWPMYVKTMLPIAAVWFLICSCWIFVPWKMWLEEPFYDSVGKRPILVENNLESPSH